MPERPDPTDVEALTDAERWEVLNAVMTEPSPEATMERIHGIIVARVAVERDRIRDDAARTALRDAADAWLHGAWGDTPRHADRVADRIGAAQHFGDWLKARSEAMEP